MVTAWQYVAGAGMLGALCPLHGHVAVADDGAGHGARVDVCVPAGHARQPSAPKAPTVTPEPSVRVTAPGERRPTVHHAGQAPGLPARPEAPGEGAQPPPVRAAAGSRAQAAPAKASAPPPRRAAAAPVTRFHVPAYHSSALERRGPNGMSTMMLMVVVTTPAVLAAAALRPRSKSAR
ncbi:MULTISPECIES: hypothetical protein [unclassified Streptomyces]|uniref:hypothetical protein n=1 Tax=unclassified Streptomyces TaxID=2593676 RepID=UPI002E33E82A|nr:MULTISPECIES: hypothetical protein [unclassified Streptomyces]WUC63844.1 hypothetical protein OG861_06160 [Streptomyces sp. NBC_00539]